MVAAQGYNFVSQLCSQDIVFPEHEGPLSIKCVFSGTEVYEVDRTRYAVDEGCYLVLNDGQKYGSAIESRQPVESFCIWFRKGFAEDVLSSLITPADRLLDEPRTPASNGLFFFDHTYANDQHVTPVIRQMRAALCEGWITPDWLDEQFHVLAERLLQAHRNVYREVERLPAVRHSTRVELYRRLYAARDYLEASVSLPVTVAELAGVAAISPHYFLRLFKSAFKETPREYHARRRMERARDLLLRTEMPVTDICYEVGFESLGSFSWLFRRRYGSPPSQFRRLAESAQNGDPEEA